MTTTPPAPAADSILAEHCQSHGDYLAGLIALAMLDTTGTPGKLPELLWSDTDPTLVRSIWETALAVGYRAGKMAGTPQWTSEALVRLRSALADAGYTAMATLAARTATLLPPPPPPQPVHPADREQHTGRPGGRP